MDSVPSLLIRLGEAQRRITELELMREESAAPVVVERVVTVEIEKPVYVDNPDHIRMIENLRERLRECQSTSQSGS